MGCCIGEDGAIQYALKATIVLQGHGQAKRANFHVRAELRKKGSRRDPVVSCEDSGSL